MASKQMLVVAAAALAIAFLLPARAVATEHVVGDDKGWTLGFDYGAWAATKQFRVGDTLVFKYSGASHTVLEVGGADFASCTKPANAAESNSGGDRVALDKEGRRWFFCGVGQHCKNNMKLKITVVAADAAAVPASAPQPPPPSSPAGKVQARLAPAVAAVTVAIAAALVF